MRSQLPQEFIQIYNHILFIYLSVSSSDYLIFRYMLQRLYVNSYYLPQRQPLAPILLGCNDKHLIKKISSYYVPLAVDYMK